MARIHGAVLEGQSESLTFQVFVSDGSPETVSAAREQLPVISMKHRGRTTLDEFAPGHKFNEVPAFVYKDVTGGRYINGPIFHIVN